MPVLRGRLEACPTLVAASPRCVRRPDRHDVQRASAKPASRGRRWSAWRWSGLRSFSTRGPPGSGGRGWSSYILGSTLADAWTAQQELEAKGVLLTIKQRVAVDEMSNSITELVQSVATARQALTEAVFSTAPDDANAKAKADALSRAEMALADARADAFTKLQTSEHKLTDSQAQSFAEQEAQNSSRGGRGGGPGGFGFGGGGGNQLRAEVLAGADFSTDQDAERVVASIRRAS